MKKNEVVIGGSYLALVSGKVVPVRITGESKSGGWNAVNDKTKRSVRIKSAQRLRRPADATTAKAAASDSPLVKAEGSQFADALNKATVAQLRDALEGRTLSAKKRSRIAATLQNRLADNVGDAMAARKRARGVAETVEAVVKGDLTQGVKIPTSKKAAKARGKATAAADQENARMRDERAASKDGQTRSERAMAASEPKAKKAAKTGGKTSGLDAAARVLGEVGKPMTAGEMVEQMLAKGYWTTGGKTPAATIYAAIIREIAAKGKASRFRKVDRGSFALAA